MSDIFISYSSQDRARAKVLAGALERQGWSVWWDRRIPPGKQFPQVIKEAVDEAKCVVVLWSKESVKSEWVQNEASEGARRKILVPALIDDVEMPFEFRRIQAARLVDWEEKSPHPEFDTLLEAVRAILGQPLPPQRDGEVLAGNTLDHAKPTGEGTQKGGSMSQKTKVLAAICIVALIAIVSIGLFLKELQSTDQPELEGKDVVITPPQTGDTFVHVGRSHSSFDKFYDEPHVVAKGHVTRVGVWCGSKYIYGLQLWYGGQEGKRHGYCDESHGVEFKGFDVPDGHLIARVEGAIAGDYVSRLQFITDGGTMSDEFGGNQTPTEKFTDEDPNGLPLRTISGYANLRRHESLSRAITSINIHFGEP